MRACSRFLLGLLLLLGPSGSGNALADDEAAVRAYFDAFARAWVAGDARAVAAEFAEDADLLRPNQPPVVGRAAIEAFYARMFEGPLKDVAKKTRVDRVRLVTPLVAVVDSSYSLDRDHPVLHARGASLTVLEKRQGRWLAVLSRSYRLPEREAR
jgi:uncharacterized protein (TIGR02246 family)